jgi:hypothetical protein
VAVPELDFPISPTSHEVFLIKMKAKNRFVMSLGDGLDRFASGEPPDYDFPIAISSYDHIGVCGGIELHRYDASSVSNKGRVQKTLGPKIPNPGRLVSRDCYQVVALEMDSIDCIGVTIFEVVRMR